VAGLGAAAREVMTAAVAHLISAIYLGYISRLFISAIYLGGKAVARLITVSCDA